MKTPHGENQTDSNKTKNSNQKPKHFSIVHYKTPLDLLINQIA